MTDKLISISDAELILSDNLLPLDIELMPLAKANGRILAEDIVADRPFPPFDRVTMDGIAIAFEQFVAGKRHFYITGIQAAGQPQQHLQNLNHCFEVMTGAMLPEGTDTVIRYEDIKIENGEAEILIESIDYQQNIHFRGRDKPENEVLILRGQKITAAEIATAATVGKVFLDVVELPRIAVVSTGDELVGISQVPEAYQIRRSNVFAVAALLKDNLGIEADLFHYNDNESEITEGIQKLTRQYEIIVISGAISEGKYDFVPIALTNNGLTPLFHGVSQRPGKPFWFGTMEASKRLTRTTRVVFALPGNPVSTFMCAVRYLLPYLKMSLKKAAAPNGIVELTNTYAKLSENFSFKPNLTYFLQVKVQNTEGGNWEAKPIVGGGSGDLSSLNDADGFLELPIDRTDFQKGEVFKFWQYRY